MFRELMKKKIFPGLKITDGWSRQKETPIPACTALIMVSNVPNSMILCTGTASSFNMFLFYGGANSPPQKQNRLSQQVRQASFPRVWDQGQLFLKYSDLLKVFMFDRPINKSAVQLIMQDALHQGMCITGWQGQLNFRITFTILRKKLREMDGRRRFKRTDSERAVRIAGLLRCFCASCSRCRILSASFNKFSPAGVSVIPDSSGKTAVFANAVPAAEFGLSHLIEHNADSRQPLKYCLCGRQPEKPLNLRFPCMGTFLLWFLLIAGYQFSLIYCSWYSL